MLRKQLITCGSGRISLLHCCIPALQASGLCFGELSQVVLKVMLFKDIPQFPALNPGKQKNCLFFPILQSLFILFLSCHNFFVLLYILSFWQIPEMKDDLINNYSRSAQAVISLSVGE